ATRTVRDGRRDRERRRVPRQRRGRLHHRPGAGGRRRPRDDVRAAPRRSVTSPRSMARPNGGSTGTPLDSASVISRSRGLDRRSPSVAAFLSFLWPGLGHLSGARRKAAALFAAPIAILLLVLFAWLSGGLDRALIDLL